MVQFLVSFIFTVSLILSATLADRERDSWKHAKLDPYTPECISIMTEETKNQYYKNFKTVDNDEIRAFYVCMLEHAGYMEADRIIVNEIMKDFLKYYEPNFEGRQLGAQILDKCNNKAKMEVKRPNIAGRFVKCVMKEIESEI
ncbi:uncharacterized protein [Chelonus insularis]|uniref:uncharacterized protein n=1 Tax=Chelonus insularis TaxID=460826 RepID=UPI00158D94B3|nr:uncharacterized protein LOC118064342 [Chelonus insularis]